MTTGRTAPAVRRPGAGVTIDRDRLVRLRQEALLSRSQLAAKMSGGPCKACGEDYTHADDCPNGRQYTITPDAIAKIENGYRRPKTSTLARLCTALGCEPEELLPGPDVPAALAPVTGPVACEHCAALYGHEAGCKDAT